MYKLSEILFTKYFKVIKQTLTFLENFQETFKYKFRIQIEYLILPNNYLIKLIMSDKCTV